MCFCTFAPGGREEHRSNPGHEAHQRGASTEGNGQKAQVWNTKPLHRQVQNRQQSQHHVFSETWVSMVATPNLAQQEAKLINETS